MVMTETLNGFQCGLQTGGRMITNLRYADDIILLATSEAGLQELVDRLDPVSRKYSRLINVDKTKVMARDGGISYQVKQRAGDRGITAENMEKSQHTDFNEDTTNESTSVSCSNIRL